MKKTLLLTIGMIAGLSLVAGGASAGPLGANITIPDESYSGSSAWYGNREDQEVEPGCVISQEYDLEAVCFDDTFGNLSIVGGYDSNTGGPDPMSAAGDLFIDIGGDAQYGSLGHSSGRDDSPSATVKYTFGYDYVVDLNFALGTYTVIDLSGAVAIKCDNEQINDASNPWRYVSGGTAIASGDIAYYDDLADGDALIVDYGLAGGSHDAFTLDLNWLAPLVQDTNFEFWTHYTMQCGNDNLMGHYPGNPGVPEPATISLLGLGLLGVVMRKKFWA